jgi:predicted O-methyltransferase YrrM
MPYGIYRLRQETKKINKTKNLVDFVFNFKIGGLDIRPNQIKNEILELVKILAKNEPKTILEIGTAKGGTLFLFSWVADPNATIVSIDLPWGRFGGGYPKWKSFLYKSFAKKNQKIFLIRADSHSKEALRKVYNIFRGKKVDFLFIDGDHTYEGVKKDFGMYNKLVKKGGIIAFHDIVLHPPEIGCEVNKFWLEIRKKYKHMEIVHNWKQKWAGIGVLYI